MTAAIILAGGRATRMGGVDKAAVDLRGRRLVEMVYDAVAGADPVIAVGPASLAAPGVRVVREDPPFGGPVAALDAALSALAESAGPASEAWVLACDLPRAGSVVAQLRELPIPDGADALILTDADGRHQWLAGRYRVTALRHAVAALPRVRDASMRALVAGLRMHPVLDRVGASMDLDTWDDVHRYRNQEDPR
ncbi:MAG: NTP transferase domain-containing protein [Gordonia sp. (in: high G+C Gram-positive bacteria)]|uniref:molybdenum cofactor guanylyltransferase n=1 Tax=Gordonia TaxID=2053 RepID=UPI00326799BC